VPRVVEWGVSTAAGLRTHRTAPRSPLRRIDHEPVVDVELGPSRQSRAHPPAAERIRQPPSRLVGRNAIGRIPSIPIGSSPCSTSQ
jgi:hypothetical protein